LPAAFTPKRNSFRCRFDRLGDPQAQSVPIRPYSCRAWARWTPEQQANYIRHTTDEHLTADIVARIATRAGVKNVVLTHLPASADPRDEYQRYADAVKKGFSGQVFVAKDLAEFCAVRAHVTHGRLTGAPAPNPAPQRCHPRRFRKDQTLLWLRHVV
jgi:hypothetical protein